MNVTYRLLIGLFGYSLHQLKRWAIELFGVDPAAAKSGGDIREFNENDGFQIILLGIFITTYRIKVKAAKQYVLRIFTEITNMGFSPAQLLREKRPAPYLVLKIFPNGVNDFSVNPPRVFPDPKLFPGGVLEFWVYEKPPEVIEDIDTDSQRMDCGRCVVRISPPQAMGLDKVLGPEYSIPLWLYLDKYLQAVKG
jgi:hypothetical protein